MGFCEKLYLMLTNTLFNLSVLFAGIFLVSQQHQYIFYADTQTTIETKLSIMTHFAGAIMISLSLVLLVYFFIFAILMIVDSVKQNKRMMNND